MDNQALALEQETFRRDGSLIASPARWRHLLYSRFEMMIATILIVALISCLGHQFLYGYLYNSNDSTNLYLRLARGAAWALLPLLLVIWLPSLRTLMSAFRYHRRLSWVPMTFSKQFHMWMGHALTALALLHGSQYLTYYTTLEPDFTDVLIGSEPDLVRAMQTNMYEYVTYDEDIDLVREWIANGADEQQFNSDVRKVLKQECTKCHNTGSTMTYAVPEFPLVTYNDVLAHTESGVASRQFRINSTGLLMLGLVAGLWLLAIPPVRRRAYHLFQQGHKLGYGIAGLALFHVPDMHLVLIPVSALLTDALITRLARTKLNCPAELQNVGADIVTLSIATPTALSKKPGQYVQIRVPELDRHEWHSFSVCGVSMAEDAEGPQLIKLRIKCHGDWTHKLRQLIPEGVQRTSLTVDLKGPFSSPVAEANRSDNWLLIAGGIGITPFLGLLDHVLRTKRLPSSITLVWTLRHIRQVSWVLPLLERIGWHKVIPIEAWIFVTDEKADLLTAPKSSFFTCNYLRGRPDWSLLSNYLTHRDKFPDAFICGPKSMMVEAARACHAKGWQVRTESF